MVTDSIFSQGQGNGIFLVEKSEAKLYDCRLHRHAKSQLLINNSKAEILKCFISKGTAARIEK